MATSTPTSTPPADDSALTANTLRCSTDLLRLMYSTNPFTPPENAKFSSLPWRWSTRRTFTPLFRNDSSRRRFERIS
ncbi:Uncharacterised protein [Bordetella pertussis]|nr:Uncharacterised protein [Bordetella pertussis]CFO09426.1 Uncharacterised protein [Bordetella pertussis]CFO76013.1 Uncharacterised protein [Bordetella pertussis]CFP65438.1 Uncharacterised protein [Bordetella pertussis]CFU86208.1 Uncharacterised protein [Bordetella pertussis]